MVKIRVMLHWLCTCVWPLVLTQSKSIKIQGHLRSTVTSLHPSTGLRMHARVHSFKPNSQHIIHSTIEHASIQANASISGQSHISDGFESTSISRHSMPKRDRDLLTVSIKLFWNPVSEVSRSLLFYFYLRWKCMECVWNLSALAVRNGLWMKWRG